MRYLCINLAYLLPLALICGCGRDGPEVSRVTGTVTLNGQSLESAKIVFLPQRESWSSFHAVIRDGKFDIKPMKRYGQGRAGTYRVVISTMPVKPPPRDQASPPSMPIKPGTADTESAIPAKYQDRKDSPLIVELRPGHNDLGQLTLTE